jgi:hypothetical protein
MSNTNTGGPAFPYPFYDEKGHCIDGIEGMTLRDYFAAKALSQLIFGRPIEDFDICAHWAYKMADAMIRARDAK